MQVDPIEVTTGGIVSNSGIAMARLGMNVAAFTLVGDDEWASVIRSRYRENDVEHRSPVDAQRGSDQYHCGADRSDRGAEFCALRRCTEADDQDTVHGKPGPVCPKPHDTDWLLLAHAQPGMRFGRGPGGDSRDWLSDGTWTPLAMVARCSRWTSCCHILMFMSPVWPKRDIKPERPSRRPLLTHFVPVVRRGCWESNWVRMERCSVAEPGEYLKIDQVASAGSRFGYDGSRGLLLCRTADRLAAWHGRAAGRASGRGHGRLLRDGVGSQRRVAWLHRDGTTGGPPGLTARFL